MVKRMTPGRMKFLMAKKEAAPDSKEWPPASWGDTCIKTTTTVLNSTTDLGAATPPTNNSEPGGISSTIPLSYLGTSGSGVNFILGDGENGTDSNFLLPCTGANKVLVHAFSNGVQAHISASLPGGNSYIVMELGSRAELTWTPAGSSSYGTWSGFWASSLMHSGCYSPCASTPKAYLTASV